MALNFSHRPIFPAHLAEDRVVSPIRISNGYLLEGISENNGDSLWLSNREIENPFDYGRERFERGGAQESVSNDVLDLLPSDPFGMDISTTFTAITGWLEDLEVDYGGYGRDEVGSSGGSYQLFAELNFIWNKAMKFQASPQNAAFDHTSNVANGFGCLDGKSGGPPASCSSDCGSSSAVDSIQNFGNVNWDVATQQPDKCGVEDVIWSSEDVGSHSALHFALGYLGLRDLLVVERVCKTLLSTVRSDTLLWKSIHIDQPLNEKITDDVLLQLTNRAQGNLKSLSLVECPRITDDGLRRVIESNPKLSKLSVPGCTRLSIEGILSSLRAFKSMGAQGVKHLRIGGLYGVTPKHFEELKTLLGADGQIQQSARKPRYYNRKNLYLSCDDDNDLDVEMCPRCENLRLVYDCPVEACQGKDHATQLCRACTLCIARCVQCGRCINDSEYEETFCLELLCSVCLTADCPENQDRMVGASKPVATTIEKNSNVHLHG
uniref:F-box protein SKIP14 n=1 Tax=Cannabis sativa TaxID=3483 RepID=A0A803PH79_CANSA